MKLFTKFAFATLLVAGVVSMSSCSDDDDNGGDAGKTVITAKKGNYTGYVKTVAGELEAEALKVVSYWVGKDNLTSNDLPTGEENPYTNLIEVKGYQDFLKTHSRIYSTNEDVITAMIQGAVTIAKEVHEAKIGDPFTNTNIFGVESWYSFNTFTDYHNNIVSIQKVIMGTEDMASIEAADKGDANSLYKLMYTADPSATGNAEKLRMAILKARQAFNAVTTAAPEKPFRDYVEESFPKVHTTIAPIQSAIAELEGVLDAVDKAYAAPAEDANVDAVIVAYVDNTVIANYKKLYEKAVELNAAVTTYADAPTQANLDAACEAWKATRIPWEHSEAWLIGPVDTYGVDPNIDSWPLSQININYLLTSEIDWSDGSGSLSQATKGFHTLEYLLFKDGQPRVIADLFVGDNVMIESAN